MDELAKLPEVEGVASCANLPIYSGSGVMAYRPGTNETIVHFNDLYEADADYVPLMEMSVIEGKAFDRSYSDSAASDDGQPHDGGPVGRKRWTGKTG